MKPWYKSWTFWCNLLTVVNLVMSILYSCNDKTLDAIYMLLLAVLLQLTLVKDYVMNILSVRNENSIP